MTNALLIRRVPTRLNASVSWGGPTVRTSDPRSSTTTVLHEPLFAIVVGHDAAPDDQTATDAALALIDTDAPSSDGPHICAALLHGASVTLGATAGMAFLARGQHIECLIDASEHEGHRAVTARAGDLYALCSPGLLAAVPVARIRWVLRSQGPPSVVARRLLAFANHTQDAREAAVVVFRIRAGV